MCSSDLAPQQQGDQREKSAVSSGGFIQKNAYVVRHEENVKTILKKGDVAKKKKALQKPKEAFAYHTAYLYDVPLPLDTKPINATLTKDNVYSVSYKSKQTLDAYKSWVEESMGMHGWVTGVSIVLAQEYVGLFQKPERICLVRACCESEFFGWRSLLLVTVTVK